MRKKEGQKQIQEMEKEQGGSPEEIEEIENEDVKDILKRLRKKWSKDLGESEEREAQKGLNGQREVYENTERTHLECVLDG